MKLISTLVVSALLAVQFSFGQIPTITDVTPYAGQVGASVTITGSNFSNTPADNIVLFGTIRATVTTSTSTSLAVTVPPGCAYEPISVRVGSGVAYSARPFSPTFRSRGEILTSSFSLRVQFPTGGRTYGIAVGDLDGDGKPDMATANWNGTVSVFRNINTGGAITTSSFSIPVNYTSGAGSWDIAIGDLDGDGKPEIVTTNITTNTVSVLKNESTTGGFDANSFLPKVDFATEASPYGLALADLDEDGRQELITTGYNSSTVSVFKNVTSTGTIDASSFRARVNFSTGGGPRDVIIADLDGDAGLDIATANMLGNSFSVIRNTNAGNVGYFAPFSFSARQDFSVSDGPNSIAVGDFDNDGKADVVTAGTTETHQRFFSIRKNVTTAGETMLSFNVVSDTWAASEPVQVKLADMEGDGNLDIVLATTTADLIKIFENSNVPGSVPTNSFQPERSFIAQGPVTAVAIADLNSDGKPDLVASNSTSSSLSVFTNNNVPVPPPTITGFSPTRIKIRETVTITGTGFSLKPENNLVKFGDQIAPVVTCTSTTITTVIPDLAMTGKISVRVNGFETAVSSQDFVVTPPPVIAGFSPANGPVGTSVTITGTRFNATPNGNVVYFGATRALVTAASPEQLTVVVPAGATYKPITVTVDGMVAYSSKPFTVTFTDTDPLSQSSFAHRTNFTSGFSTHYGSAVGDIDGDGKPDIVAAGWDGIAVFRNISTPGPITVNSFAPKIDIALPPQRIYGVKLEDLDADGKLDLLAISDEGVSFYRNTGAPGTLTAASFAARVDITAHGSILDVSDIDADGKPDIIVSDKYPFISVLKNIGIGGSPDFAPAVSFETIGNSFDIAVGDLDGDNKPDIAFPNVSDGNVVSVFRNVTTAGAVDQGSFQSKVDFTTFLGGNETIGLGDLDGDGKTDIVTGTYQAGGAVGISILRNTSTPGPFSSNSFAPKVDLVADRNPSKLRLTDLNGDGKPDIAVVGCGISSCFISVNVNASTPGVLTTASFEARKNYTVGGGSDFVEAADLDGDGRPELISGVNNSIAVLQDIIPASPKINGFSPTSGPVGTSVYVFGTGFSSTASDNKISFNGVATQAITSTTTGLTVRVPPGATTGIMSITVGSKSGTSSSVFSVTKTPQTITFNALSPKTYGDPSFALSASTDSGLPVTYTSSNTAVAVISNNIITIKGGGTTTITARQEGDDLYDAAPPVQRVLTVNKVPQTISFTALPEKSVGDPAFPLSAVATSGLPVSFTSSNEAVAIIVNNIVTVTGTGNIVITAAQPGNNQYAAAAPVQQQLVVKKAGQTITFEAIPSKTVGDPSFTLAATASSGLPVAYTSSNTTVAKITGSSVTIIAEGTTLITATQDGNGQYLGAIPVTRSLTVQKAGKLAQQVTFNVLPVKKYGDPSFTLNAITTSGLPITYSSSNPSVATVSGRIVTVRSPGTATITATQSGSAAFKAAIPVEQVLTVERASQQITFGLLRSASVTDGSFYLGASSSSGLPVSYHSSNPAVATISANKVIIVGTGSTDISATQAGNVNYDAATPVVRLLEIRKRIQTITFADFSPRTVNDIPFALDASASSGLHVTYTSSNPAVARVDGNMVTITGAGEANITATQEGNEDFEAAAPVTRKLVVILITDLTKNPAAEAITIYPNPVSAWLNVSLPGTATSHPVKVRITDLYGRTVLEQRFGTGTHVFQINVEQLSDGLYFFQCLEGNRVNEGRFVKQ